MAPRRLSGFDEICTCGGTEKDDEGEAQSAAAFSVTEPLGFGHARTHTHTEVDHVTAPPSRSMEPPS